MKKKNKIIAIIIAVALVFSAFVIGTVANTKNTALSVSIDKTELSAGETATVTVKASADYPVATASIPVFYDKTLVEVSNPTATLTGYAVSATTTDATAVDSTLVYANTGVDSAKFGFVLATYIGEAGAAAPEKLENATVLTFTVTAKQSVSGNAVIKCVTESAKTDENIEGMLYFGTTTNGTTIDTIPENVEGIDVSGATASVTVKTAKTELMASTEKTGVVDAENKYVYGITPGDNVEDYFDVTNGTLELVANSAGYTNGTGATVNVKNSSGTVVDTYTVIIFGDVNGDSTITAKDISAIKSITQNVAYSEYAMIAADVSGATDITATNVTAADLSTIKGYTQNVEPTVNPYA